MVRFIQVSGRICLGTEWVTKDGQMDLGMKASGRIIRQMLKEFSSMYMEINMKVS